MSRRDNFASTKFLLAIDVGTTFTAASFCILKEGRPWILQEFNEWPMQDYASAKVPSVIYYDSDNNPRLYGAETTNLHYLNEAEGLGWRKAEWWKLHLHPDYLPLPAGFTPAPLPHSVDAIYSHYLAFVKRSIRPFIMKKGGLDEQDMSELEKVINVILTTPNGWEGCHQHRFRLAALRANLVSEGHQVRFVSEGEAALHYALGNKDRLSYSKRLKINSVILVCDVGGGTTDIGCYRIKGLDPMKVDEVCSPGCYVAGGTFVNERAKDFIIDQIRGTHWDNPDVIATALRDFEVIKRQFSVSQAITSVALDGSTQSLEARNIKRGRLMISSAKMASFFDPIIEIITQALDECVSDSGQQIDHIVVVGGFMDSNYPYSKLEKWARIKQISIGKPDGVLSKVIAHGALSWYLHSAVGARIAKFHYGAETDDLFDSKDPEMRGRTRFQNILGETRCRYAWNSIVTKASKLNPNAEYRAPFHHEFGNEESRIICMDIFAYRFENPPKFFRDKDGHLVNGFIELATIKADLTSCYNAAVLHRSSTGKEYKRLEYEICLSFKETEIQARLRWKQNNRYKYGTAVVVYDV